MKHITLVTVVPRPKNKKFDFSNGQFPAMSSGRILSFAKKVEAGNFYREALESGNYYCVIMSTVVTASA